MRRSGLNTKGHYPGWICLFTLAIASVSGCTSPSSTTVSINVHELLVQSSQLGTPISLLKAVAIREGATVAELRMDVETAQQAEIDLEVPAGNVLFELTGFTRESEQLTPLYFGDSLSMITPYERNDLNIAMFKAGLLDVKIQVPEATEALPNTLVRFIPLNPSPRQSETYSSPFAMGTLSRVLPAGSYQVQAEASFDGRKFSEISEQVTVDITAGETHSVDLVIEL